jgi:UDP:flavonoid glycosyltransferase YjiC (YdhE family)
MRVLIAATGSYGDIYPFVAIGRDLKRRGHDVRFFASSYFTPLVERSGLTAVGIGSPDAYEAVIRHPDVFHPKKGIRLVARTNLEYLPEVYERMDEQIVPRETIVIGSTLAFAARLFQETRGVPTATVHLAPSLFRSAVAPPRFDESGLLEKLPAFVNRALFYVVDRLVVDPTFCPGFNRFRAGLGLPPVKGLFGDWMHQANVVVGLFPSWFAEKQRDWPGNIHLTGFPLEDGSKSGESLSQEAAKFLDSAKRPVIFTAGTAATTETRFFEESAEACRLAGIDGIFLTRYREQVPRDLPGNVRHFDYLPFSLSLPRVHALVHHGGIGTSSQALAAGVPQLVRPLAYDQFDNAHRLVRIGAARVLSPARYRAPAVAAALDELTGSEAVRAAALVLVKRKLESYDAVSATADVILKELTAKGSSRPSTSIRTPAAR